MQQEEPPTLYSRVGQKLVDFLHEQPYHREWGLEQFVPEDPDDCGFEGLEEQLQDSDVEEEFFHDNRENMISLIKLLHLAMRRIRHVYKLYRTGAPRRKKESSFQESEISKHDSLGRRLLWILFSEKSKDKNPDGLKYHVEWGVEMLIPDEDEEYPGKNLIECLESDDGGDFFREHSEGMIKVVQLLHVSFSILEEADAYYTFKHFLPTKVGKKTVASAVSSQEEEESDDEALLEKKRKRVKRVED